MRSINKNHAPKVLSEFEAKLKEMENYDSLDTFEALKNDVDTLIPVQLSIADEQGYVCCYCQSSFKTYEDSKGRERVQIEIEHYKPKSIFNGKPKRSFRRRSSLLNNEEEIKEDLRIDYSNLLGACQNSNQCGNAKGDTILKHIPNPATTKTKKFPEFGYNMKGKIRSLEKDENSKKAIQAELDNILGLNNTTIKNHRVNTWVGVKRKIQSKCKLQKLHTGGKREIDYAKELIEIYSKRKSDNKHFEFYDCIIHLLKREYKDWI